MLKQMSELIERYVNEHKDGWYAQGKEEGKADKANQIAMKMVQMNVFSVDEIAQITGLSIDKVKALKCR